MKKLFSEFNEFISRGNVLDLAVGVIIGSAFAKVVNSVVDNIIMPPLGLILGSSNFSDFYIVLKQGQSSLPLNATLEMAQQVGTVTWNYGQFLTDIISFLLLAIGVFLLIKGIQPLQKAITVREEKEKADAKLNEKECPYCFTDIPVKAVRCPNCTSQLDGKTS